MYIGDVYRFNFNLGYSPEDESSVDHILGINEKHPKTLYYGINIIGIGKELRYLINMHDIKTYKEYYTECL